MINTLILAGELLLAYLLVSAFVWVMLGVRSHPDPKIKFLLRLTRPGRHVLRLFYWSIYGFYRVIIFMAIAALHLAYYLKVGAHHLERLSRQLVDQANRYWEVAKEDIYRRGFHD